MSFGNRSLAIARSRYTATLGSYQAELELRADEYFTTGSDRQFYRFTIPPVEIDPCYKTCLLYLRSFHFVDPLGSWSFDNGADLKQPITTPSVEVRVQHIVDRVEIKEVPTDRIVQQEVPVMIDKVIVRDVPYPVERFVEKEVLREIEKIVVHEHPVYGANPLQ